MFIQHILDIPLVGAARKETFPLILLRISQDAVPVEDGDDEKGK
jgi:hypothetical protein